MSELYMMVTITNRQLTRKFVECYKENGAQVGSVTVGMGTAANEILDYFGLDGMEKSVLFHLVTDAAWRQIKPALRKKMQIDLPGMGIAFIIPVSSVGGRSSRRSSLESALSCRRFALSSCFAMNVPSTGAQSFLHLFLCGRRL